MTRAIASALAVFGLLMVCPAAEAVQLVANWRFEGDFTDSSTLANDLTIAAGSPTFSGTVPPGGLSTQSLSLDGNDQLEITSSTGLDFTSRYTFAGWVNTSAPGSGKYHGIFWRGPSGSVTSSDIEVYTQPSGQVTVAHNRSNGGTFDYLYYAAPPSNTFCHLAVTYDASQSYERVKVYYDGVQQTPAAQTPDLAAPLATSGHEISVGKLGGSSGFHASSYYNGLLDEVSVYNVALSPGELDRLIQLGDAHPARAGILYTGEADYPGGAWGDKLVADGGQDGIAHAGATGGVQVDTNPANARFGDQSFSFQSAGWPNTIELPDSTDLGNAFTLAGFVNADAATATRNNRLFSAYDGGGPASDELLFDFNPDGTNTWVKGLRAYVNGVAITPSSPVDFPTGEYHHLAMTYDDGLVTTYLDGELVAQGPVGSGPISLFENLRVGEDSYGGANEQLIGNVDEILLLYRALSPEEIAVLAGSPYLNMIPEPSAFVLLALGGLGLLLLGRRRKGLRISD